jgi:hypothetical protein
MTTRHLLSSDPSQYESGVVALCQKSTSARFYGQISARSGIQSAISFASGDPIPVPAFVYLPILFIGMYDRFVTEYSSIVFNLWIPTIEHFEGIRKMAT